MNHLHDPSNETITTNSVPEQLSNQVRGTLTSAEFRKRVAESHAGSSVAINELLIACRNYLMMVADRAIKQGLQSKVATVDLVRDTMNAAKGQFVQFQGETEEELLRWLTGIMESRIGEALKWYFGHSHVDSHQPIDWYQLFSNTSTQLNTGLGDARDEVLQETAGSKQLRQIVAGLALDQQAVVRLRIEDRLSFDEIGARLTCTADAARLLFLRAVNSLPQQNVASQNENRSRSFSPTANE